MTAPLTLAEVQALSGFTEGPWIYDPNDWTLAERAENGGKDARLMDAAPALHATCLHLHAEVARLTAELEKPEIGPWEPYLDGVRRTDYREAMALVAPSGFWHVNKGIRIVAYNQEESADAGKRAADLALVAAGYRLVGGVFGEVSDMAKVESEQP